VPQTDVGSDFLELFESFLSHKNAMCSICVYLLLVLLRSIWCFVGSF